MRKQYGDDKVYDFSLGNPDLPPPPEVKQALEEIAAGADRPFAIGYMPNALSGAARTACRPFEEGAERPGFPPQTSS